jgi:hypothetical protein
MKLRIKITDKGNKTNLHLDPLFWYDKIKKTNLWLYTITWVWRKPIKLNFIHWIDGRVRHTLHRKF